MNLDSISKTKSFKNHNPGVKTRPVTPHSPMKDKLSTSFSGPDKRVLTNPQVEEKVKPAMIPRRLVKAE